jgi:membrane-bound metal-dependent hydrolase YbcI (DUF457 family)
MIAGHFGFAAAVKAKSPTTPLWALMLACQWLDIVFVVLFLAGIERLEPIAGAADGAYGAVIIHADYTHSLIGAAVLSVVFGLLLGWRYGPRSGAILGAVAMSHWILDLFVHRHDMPLYPSSSSPPFGFGLWQYPMVAAAIELALVLVGALLYWRAARRIADRNSIYLKRANWSGTVVLVSGLVTLLINRLGF